MIYEDFPVTGTHAFILDVSDFVNATLRGDEKFTLWAEEFARCQAWKMAESLFKFRGNIQENEATFF